MVEQHLITISANVATFVGRGDPSALGVVTMGWLIEVVARGGSTVNNDCVQLFHVVFVN